MEERGKKLSQFLAHPRVSRESNTPSNKTSSASVSLLAAICLCKLLLARSNEISHTPYISIALNQTQSTHPLVDLSPDPDFFEARVGAISSSHGPASSASHSEGCQGEQSIYSHEGSSNYGEGGLACFTGVSVIAMLFVFLDPSSCR